MENFHGVRLKMALWPHGRMVVAQEKKQNTFLSVKNIRAYDLACSSSDAVWDEVVSWDWFAKKTIGSQWVNATDSVAANIAEGFGRFHKKDKQKFYYNARGSVQESIFWAEQAHKRTLVNEKDYKIILEKLSSLPKELNWLIKVTEIKLAV